MRARRIRLLAGVPSALLAVALGYHPAYLLALFGGVLLPDVDAVDRRFHRSWLFHTFLLPAIAYQAVSFAGVDSPAVVTAVHFVTVGMACHFVCDYAFPKTRSHSGAEWPVRPTIWAAPWGLMWLGLAWFAQWFLYLADAFLPWVIAALG